MNFWLFKTEPSVYSFADLTRDKKTNWDHVRNFQARNTLKACKKGDFALIYHSGDEKKVVGLAQITKEAYPDIDPNKAGEWVQVDLKMVFPLPESLTLAAIKKTSSLQKLPLIKHTRLSCMKIETAEFNEILKLGQAWDSFQKYL